MPRLGSLASKAAPARPPSSDPCVARRQYAACASMQVRHSRRSAAARHARERARACTSAWKSTSRRPSTSASARPCRARHAASPSPSRRTAVSDSSSVHSATTVQMEPPIQPYSEAFCHLRPRMGRQAWLPCQGLVTPDPGQRRAAPRAPRAAPPRRGASGHARPAPQHGRLPPPLGRARAAPPHSLLPHAERLRAVRVRRTERLSSAKPQQHATRASLRRLQHAAGGGKQAPGRQGLRRGRPAHRRGHDLQAGRMYAARARRTPAACLTPTRRAHRRCRQARRCGQRPPTPWRAPRHRLLLGGLPGRAPLHRLLVGEDAGLAGPDDMVRAKVHGHQHLLELRRARAPARRAACGGRAERACGTGGRGRRAPC